MIRNFRHLLEYAVFRFAFFIFSLLPPEKASALGGKIGTLIGPFLGVTKKARRNLERAFPDKTDAEVKTITKDMWENIGRVIGEYPHLQTLAERHVEIVNADRLEQLKNDDKPAILFGAHLANWELTGVSLLVCGLETHAVIREPNNPYFVRFMERQRSGRGQIATIPKSPGGARQIVRHLKDGKHIGIFIDQKYNEGVETLFFGRPAMTSPAFVELAQKFKCPLVPVRMERLEGVKFRLTLYEPLEIFHDDGAAKDVRVGIDEAHALLENWIRQRPGQWIWLHRRWKNEHTRANQNQ